MTPLMNIKLPETGVPLEIEIESIAPNGKGKGRAAAYPKISFFVENTAPGDHVRAVVTQARKRYVEAELLELLAPGADRVAPPCPFYDECGGCQLMHLTYEAQLAAKRESLAYLLRRRKFTDVDVPPVEPSPLPLRYRVRSALNFGEGGTVGFNRRRSHDTVPVDSCQQMREALDTAFFAASRRMAAQFRGVATKVAGVLDDTTGRVVVHPFNGARDMHSPENWFLLGDDVLAPVADLTCRYQSHGFDFEYAPDCFTQVNPALNERLVAHAVESMELTNRTRVLELFAGIGNFTLPVAARARRVTAVEWHRGASFLRRNAGVAGLGNVTTSPGDAAGRLRELAKSGAQFDTVLLDPPREGLGAAGLEHLGLLQARRIVYVSCEPTSLLADLESLARAGYHLKSIRAFDMFPQTYHMETVAVLER